MTRLLVLPLIAEVRELLDIQGQTDARCDDVRHCATEKKLQLERKIRALQAMSTALGEMIDVCEAQDNKPLEACPIVEALEAGLATRTLSEEEGR